MSAPSTQQAQHQSAGGTSNPSSRVGSGSPVDNKRVLVKSEESHPAQPSRASTESRPEQESTKKETRETNARSQNEAPAGTNTPDYFSLPRPSRLDQELNPFEQSFAHPGATSSNDNPLNTPKATVLPPVTAMTSPALGGSGSYNWGPNSLRSGPLSPAMLPGPTNPSLAAFDSHLRTGLTPNESGIRSGLTPGGTGSLFHAASPSSTQFLFNSTTPGTMEFQKTALSAAQKSSRPLIPPSISEIKNEGELNANRNETAKPRQASDPFAQDPAHNAANGLYLLAHMGGNGTPNNFQQGHISGMQPTAQNSMDSSPNLAKRAAMNNATSAASRAASNSVAPNGVREISEASNPRSESSEEPEMPSSARKGRSSKGRTPTATTGKRRNENGSETKTTPAKKAKNNRAMSASDDGEGEEYDEDGKKDNKKMTDEEKRKNFLERNRVAALKCRQRKKQWLANLQAKVEMYGTENDALNAQVQQLREEIVSLKTLLLAHKDCPVARANGVQLDMASLAAGTGDYNHMQMMPTYPGMMPGVMHQQPPGERRYS